MDQGESVTEFPDIESGRPDLQDSKHDPWSAYAAALEGSRRTYALLLERLEQSRALLRDLTARLRGS